ncbi:DUF3119 family protein [Prochlorococcus sp. MIT 1307]|uniref:DUF3119 family protein n=1 Tax=Prochlorococcus sp. MIT 1307 TaxID=3096219 RepID=UPI002A75168A|nr:DUF3119 family protein [Prochlorococcus sp. MIT 1307]
MSTQTQLDPSKSVVLKPSYRLPLIIIFLGLSLFLFPPNPWPAICISVFGLFLLIQSLILRLEFTANDLIVWQLDRELRRFPFKSWLAWRILLPQLPGIFYFREEASPHLLPILFDPKTLENQLKLRVGALETPKNDLSKSS